MRKVRLSPGVGLALLWTLGCGVPPDAPAIRNVVLVSLDALGAKHVGTYGYPRDTTPNLDSLAAEGAVFESAYTQQVWTLSSHLTMVTGLTPQAHGASRRRPSSAGATSLAEILKQNGFATAAFMGAGGYASPAFGLGRGFDTFQTGVGDARRDNRARMRWLDEQARLLRQQPERRFFLLAHYYDPHSDANTEFPYHAPEPYRSRYLGSMRWDRRGDTSLLFDLQREGGPSALGARFLTALYDGGARYADEVGLGPLLQKLRHLDLADDTLVIVTADHGEQIFEHGKCCHRQPYVETAWVPLVMRGPGIAPGIRIPDLVQLVDLTPTILSLLSIPAPDHVQGRDLSPLLRGDSLPPSPAFVDGIFGGAPPYLDRQPSCVTLDIDGRRWSYVNTVYDRPGDGGRIFETRSVGELYLLDEDPEQHNDVAAGHPELVRRLNARLIAWYAESEALARSLGPAADHDWPLGDQERERLRALGYAE